MAEIQEIRSVLVANISPSANEKTVSDFFSFCGKISQLFLRKEEGKDTSFAVIQFETESAAKTALLLTNALIVDRPITVSTYLGSSSSETVPTTTAESVPTPILVGTPVESENISHKDFGGVPDHERSKTSVVASLLAAGYILAENALDKAKEVDEKTNFSSRAKVTVDQLKVKAHEIDVQYGLSDKANAVKNSITETAKKVDNELGLSEKASAAATAIKSGSQAALQKAQENPTIKKGMESVKATAQKVSDSMNQTFNDVKQQTNKEIEVQEKAAAQSGGYTPVPTTDAPTPVTMETTPETINQ